MPASYRAKPHEPLVLITLVIVGTSFPALIRVSPQPSQVPLWNTTWGGAEDDYGHAVAVGGEGIYVVGATESYGQTRVGSLPANDVFIAKFDVKGEFLWNRTWGGSEDDEAYGVAVSGGGVYVTGRTNLLGAGDYDAFLLKYDVNGNLLWSTTWGGSKYDSSNGVAVGDDGVYITGLTKSFGVTGDVLVAKFGFNGNLLWYRTWGGDRNEWGAGIAISDDFVYVVGTTNSLGLGILDDDGFLLKYDPNGSLLLNVTWGGPQYDGFSGVAVDSGVPYMTGYTNSFGAGRYDAVVACRAPQRVSTNIALSLSRDALDLGQPLLLSGGISPPPGRVRVVLTYTRPNGSAVTEETLTSGEGAITYTYVPDEEGDWNVRASWLGNEEFAGAASSSYSFTVRQPSPFSYVAVGAAAVLVLAVLLVWRSRRKPPPPPPPASTAGPSGTMTPVHGVWQGVPARA